MKKQKRCGLTVWSVLLYLSMVIVIVGFVFGLTKEGIGLYSAESAALNGANGLYLLEMKTQLAMPLTIAFGQRFLGLGPTFIFTVVIFGIALICTIALIAVACAKKAYAKIAHVIPLYVATFILLYAALAIAISVNGGASPIRELFAKRGVLYNALLSTKSDFNMISRIFAWVFFAGSFLLTVSTIGYFAIVIKRCAEVVPSELPDKVKLPDEKERLANFNDEKAVVAEPVKAVAEPKIMPTTVPAIEKTAAVDETPVEEKPKKRVFLIVKKYNATAEKVTPVEEEKPVETITMDSVREALKAELDYRDALKAKECCKNNNSVVCSATQAPVAETRCVATPKATKEENKPSTPIIICIPQPVVEEEAKPEVKEEPAPAITSEDIKAIVRDELAKAIKEIIAVPAAEPEVETVEEIVETVAVPETHETVAVLNKDNVAVNVEEPAPVVEEPVVEKEEPKSSLSLSKKAAKEEPKSSLSLSKKVAKEEPKPVVEPKAEVTPVVEEPAKEEPAERLSFSDRIKAADDEMKDNYNHVKSLLMSYGLKSRVSNGGDAFRLHKVTYAKVCVAGKSLKIYLALDPQDYKNSTYPVKDASSKAIYKDIPLVFKVKSGLSMRRCEQLIGEMMDKHGVDQVDRVEIKDYVSTLEETNTDDEE